MVRSDPLIHEITKTEQFLTLIHSLQAAALITFRFFQTFFAFIYQSSGLLLRPLAYMARMVWYILKRPLELFVHVRALYPILLFCLVAVCCGLFIGGCAGFVSEAFSSVVITAKKEKHSSVLIRRIQLSSKNKNK
ncbi:unnamed protein product [Rhizopus stolonifer]